MPTRRITDVARPGHRRGLVGSILLGSKAALQRMALLVPPIRRLHSSRAMLIEERATLSSQVQRSGSSPFHHYHSCFDAEAVLRRHAVPDPQPRPGYFTNFLGVAIDPKFFPGILDGRAGHVEGIPIPANWHADIAEWAAALRAVDLARERFVMIELGCGWGCWMNNTGAAARRAHLPVALIGVEGDERHIAYAHEAASVNGFDPASVTLHHGIAAAGAGTALFPRQGHGDASWGLEPIFHATHTQVRDALRSGSHDELPMVPLLTLIGTHERIDLLHIDIQGGEADLIADCLQVLRERVAYLLVGTHSRQIEGRIVEFLSGSGWILEIERPAILSLAGRHPVVTVDGVQGWRNPALHPEPRRVASS